MNPLITSIQFSSEHTGNYRHSLRGTGAEVIGTRRDDTDAEFFAVSFAGDRLDLGVEVSVVIDGHRDDVLIPEMTDD